MKSATLLHHVSLYSFLKRYQFIKDIPEQDRALRPLLLSFGIYGDWYVPVDTRGLVTKNGKPLPFHTVYLHSGEILVGFRDLTSAAGTEYESAWRDSLNIRIQTEAGLLKPQPTALAA